jgi:myo-inositol-1(or 4)-monophosphatase
VELGHKGEAGVLTAADVAANACLQSILLQAFPDDGWLSEETADRADRLRKERVWIVDPLDGSREFAAGRPECAVSVGWCVAGEAVLGVVYNPITAETFAGLRGEGAWLHRTPIRVSSTSALAASRFCVSRTESGKGLLPGVAAHLHLHPLGSVAYKCALVAAGRYDGVFAQNPRNEWDLCAGVALLEAAGGRVTDRHGRPYRFNQPNPLKPPPLATNGRIHAAALAVLRSAHPPAPQGGAASHAALPHLRQFAVGEGQLQAFAHDLGLPLRQPRRLPQLLQLPLHIGEALMQVGELAPDVRLELDGAERSRALEEMRIAELLLHRQVALQQGDLGPIVLGPRQQADAGPIVRMFDVVDQRPGLPEVDRRGTWCTIRHPNFSLATRGASAQRCGADGPLSGRCLGTTLHGRRALAVERLHLRQDGLV